MSAPRSIALLSAALGALAAEDKFLVSFPVDWRALVWRSCFDKGFREDGEDLNFELCCRHGRLVHDLIAIVGGLPQPKGHHMGNPYCFGDQVNQHDRCCALNANLEKLPGFSHPIWQFKMVQGPMINVVQGQVVQGWIERGIMSVSPVPPRVQLDGEGMLWAGGLASLALSIMDFHLPQRGRRRRLLELAASVGAPSLVALAQGFAVWSSDLRNASAWQRSAGARASFGADSAEMRRFHTPRVDLLDERTWPRRKFDVVLLASSAFGAGGVPDEVKRACCDGFRRIAATRLEVGGVALLFQQAAYLRGNGGSLKGLDDYHCVRPDGPFAVALHQARPDGSWHSQWMHRDFVETEPLAGPLPVVYTLQRRNETPA